MSKHVGFEDKFFKIITSDFLQNSFASSMSNKVGSVIRNGSGKDPDAKFSEKSDLDQKTIISDPQHCILVT